jgi:hypothetical protein
MSGRVLFVFKFKDPLELRMRVFHGAEVRVDVQHEAMRVGLVVRSNELDALNPIISDGSACNREVVGLPLMTPLIYQTGPKTSAKSGWSCSMREKRCISGRSLATGIMGIRS